MVSLLVLFSYLCYFFSNSDNYTVRKFKWWHYGLALWEEIFDQFPLFDFTSHRALQYCHQSNTAKCAKTCLTVYGCLLWAGTRRRRWTWLTAGWVSPSCSPPRRSSTPTWTRWAWWPTFHSSPMLRSVLRGRTYEVVHIRQTAAIPLCQRMVKYDMFCNSLSLYDYSRSDVTSLVQFSYCTLRKVRYDLPIIMPKYFGKFIYS